jgi:hypothetical protein
MRRSAFLPAFFVALALVFGTAVVLRLRAVSTQTPANGATVSDAATPANGSRNAADRRDAEPVVPDTDSLATATIVDANSPEGVSAAARTRAERFQELLKAAPPSSNSSAASMTAPAPTQPIAAAAVAAPPPKPIARPTRAVPAISAGGRDRASAPQASSTPERPGSDKPRDPDDPNSDTNAPQLVSIEFTPQQVRDGEDAMMTVVATDDLSGVRNISGSIASPSGALQGFALSHDADGNRWVTRITVPKDAAEGIWRVNYLSLMDNASNSVNLGTGGALPASASFRVVSSRPDSTGPTLKAIWLQKGAMRAGEKNLIYVQAEDDKSGVTLVSGVFHSPSATARIGFACRQGSAGAWECDLSPPTCLDCGEWKLEQLQMQDKANNMTTLRNENQLVASTRIDIGGESCDSGPPELSSLALDRHEVSNHENTVINVTAIVTDDACGVASLSGQALGPSASGGSRLYISFKPSGSGNVWIGQLAVPRLASKGVWTVSWMQILDKGQNLKTYSTGDPVLNGAMFKVQ